MGGGVVVGEVDATLFCVCLNDRFPANVVLCVVVFFASTGPVSDCFMLYFLVAVCCARILGFAYSYRCGHTALAV